MCRVTGVADGQVPLQAREGALVEDGGDQAHVLDDRDRVTVGHRHARRLLAAVLQGEETVEREVGHPHAGRVDPEDTAGFLHASAHSRTGLWHHGSPRARARFPSYAWRRASTGRSTRVPRVNRAPPAGPSTAAGIAARRGPAAQLVGIARGHDEARGQLGEELGRLHDVERAPGPGRGGHLGQRHGQSPARHVVDGVHQRFGLACRPPAPRPARRRRHTPRRAPRSRPAGPAPCGGPGVRWPSASPPAGRSRPLPPRGPSRTTVSPADQASPGGGAWTASTRPSTPSTGVGSMSDPPLSL